jgi:peptidoglycan/LPS O-acetylase OafA/YrhL
MSKFKYRPDVDGLRAVAVSMVMLYHAGLGFPGGFVGVDVFFVISGFLITGLILKERMAGTFSFPNFWIRRIRRIIPASTFMALTVLLTGAFLLLPNDYKDLGKSAIAQQFALSNVYFWQTTGYFDGPSDLKPFLHTWSLAVEEQFYLGYPFLIFVLTRFPKTITTGGVLSLCVLSFAISCWGVVHYPSATFFLLPTRAWELLLGGLICFAPESTRLKDWKITVLSWLGLGLIVISGLYFTKSTQFPGLNALLPCGATALLVYMNSLRLTPAGRMLASKPIVFVGLLSYSLYLWHWPILAFLRYRVGERIPNPLGVAALGLSFACAWLSWRFVETPFRTQAWLKPPKQILVAVAFVIVAISLIGVCVSIDGASWRFPSSVLKVINIPYAGKSAGVSGSKASGWVIPQIGYQSGTSLHPTFVLWGDSHAKCISVLCDEIARRHRITGFDAGKGGTPPLLGAWPAGESSEAADFNEFVFDFAIRHKIKWLILVAAWDVHADGMSHLRDQEGVESFAVLKRSFERTLARAEKEKMEVAVLLQSPYQRTDVPSRVARDILNGSDKMSYGVSRAVHEDFQRRSRRYFESLGRRIVLLDAGDAYFDAEGRSIIGARGQPFYSDSGHLSREGVRVFINDVLNRLFSDIAKGK